MKLITLIFAVLISTGSTAGDNPSLYFITPQDGDVVSGEFTIQFGLRGMGVAPAGIKKENTGHHHLLIDLDTLPVMDAPLPNNEQLRHFGGGQTQTSLSLPSGKHTLQLVLGNYAHIPHKPPVISDKISITVK